MIKQIQDNYIHRLFGQPWPGKSHSIPLMFLVIHYVTHMKFREFQGFAWFSYIGHSDLHNAYYGMLHVWYTPGKQWV